MKSLTSWRDIQTSHLVFKSGLATKDKIKGYLLQPTILLKTGSLYNAIQGNLIGLATVVYEPLYHAQEKANIKLSSGCSCKAKSARCSDIS